MNTKVEEALAAITGNYPEAANGGMTLEEARTTLAAHIAQQDATIARVLALAESWRGEVAQYDKEHEDSSDPEDWMAGHRDCIAELIAALNQEQAK